MNRFVADLKHDIKDDCMRCDCIRGVMKDDCMARYDCNAAFLTKTMRVREDETNQKKMNVTRARP